MTPFIKFKAPYNHYLGEQNPARKFFVDSFWKVYSSKICHKNNFIFRKSVPIPHILTVKIKYSTVHDGLPVFFRVYTGKNGAYKSLKYFSETYDRGANLSAFEIKDSVFYVGTGTILDSNFDPLVMLYCTLTLDNEIINYYLYVSEDIFTEDFIQKNNILYKKIIELVIPSAIAEGIEIKTSHAPNGADSVVKYDIDPSLNHVETQKLLKDFIFMEKSKNIRGESNGEEANTTE